MSPSNIHPETAQLLEESGLPNLTLIYLISAGCVLLVVGGRGYPILSYSNPVICTYSTYTCLPHAHLSLLYRVVSLYGIPSWTSAHVSLLHSCEGLDSGRELASWWGQSTAAESIILLLSIDINRQSQFWSWLDLRNRVVCVHMMFVLVGFGFSHFDPFRNFGMAYMRKVDEHMMESKSRQLLWWWCDGDGFLWDSLANQSGRRYCTWS